jgi:hypothetical protein
MMKRLLYVLAALALLASPAAADITVTMSLTIGGPVPMDGTTVVYFKGAKGRTDVKMMGQDMSVFMDAAAKQQWLVNHVTKETGPVDVQKSMGQLPVDFGSGKVSVTPNGQTKEILGRVCQGFAVEMTLPMTLGGETVTMKMTGPMWVAKEGPGIAEYKAAQKAFADSGMAVSPLAQGPQVKVMVELAKALADAGVMLEQEQAITIEGTGQMAQMMAQVGSMTTRMKVTAISTDPIPDEKFVLPESYVKK